MTDMTTAVYTSRDFAESYGEMTRKLADTCVKGAFETLPADAREALAAYAGGTEPSAVYVVRARDNEGVMDLAIKFAGRRAGVCFWDELAPEEQAAPYFSMAIDYAPRRKAADAAPRSGADSARGGKALMTAEIVLHDRDLVFVFGGPVDQAEAMSAGVAARLNIEPAGAGSLLRVTMSGAEMAPIVAWIKDIFPAIGFVTRPLPLRAAKSPWRLFRLVADEDMRDALEDADLVKTIAVVVDGLYEQAAKWGFESDAGIGSVVADRDPLLRIVVEEAAQTVFVSELPPGTKLPENLSQTPYGNQPHH